jgi:hypothetical protein
MRLLAYSCRVIQYTFTLISSVLMVVVWLYGCAVVFAAYLSIIVVSCATTSGRFASSALWTKFVQVCQPTAQNGLCA